MTEGSYKIIHHQPRLGRLGKIVPILEKILQYHPGLLVEVGETSSDS